VLHHVPRPGRFLDEARRVLRTGGHLLMHEPHASVLFCAVLRAMRHEGYSFDVDVFDAGAVCTDPVDLWSGNNAIPRLLFDDHTAFARAHPGWRIVRDEPCECLMFLNSGGVTAKTAFVPLPTTILRAMQHIDRMLARVGRNVFAVGRRVALQAT
jgi:SAM-dependent methyltransferase